MRRQIEGWKLRAGGFALLASMMLIAGMGDTRADDPPSPVREGPGKQGLAFHDARAFPGYTLISSLNSPKTYLIDLKGRVVKKWECKIPAMTTYLLPNGNLLRLCSLQGKEKAFGGGPGAAGRVQEHTWDGEVIWDYTVFNEKQLSHHDVCKLPNGNVLMVVWDKKTDKEAIAAGRRPALVRGSYLLPDSVLEVKPTGKTTGEIVWEWHLWDHLVQDHDKTKANFGKVSEHPELVDINYTQEALANVARTKDGAEKLKSIGYVGSSAAAKQRVNPDWTHVNSVTYNAELDQIALTVHAFSEVWILDHSTTTAEAASHKGGKSGKGGDLLYRWGNPQTYKAGTAKDQKLWHPHFSHWIPKGYPGEGHLILFNNGMRRPEGPYSSVEELELPLDAEGKYTREPGATFGPEKPVWSYTAPKKTDFYSMIISGAHRLPNGHTLVCAGVSGTVFEVTPKGETVWKYVNPSRGEPLGPPGLPPGVGPPSLPQPPKPGEIVPEFLQNALELKPEQRKTLNAFHKEVGTRLEQLLGKERLEQFEAMQKGGPRGFGGAPQPGQIITSFQQARLKLTPDQKKELAGLQKEADNLLEKTLEPNQKKRLGAMRDAMSSGRPPAGPGMPGPTPTSLFRSYRYGVEHPGLAGKELKPGDSIEKVEAKAVKPKSER